MLDDCIGSLGAVFKQTVPDVSNQFGNFAFGLLQLSYIDPSHHPNKNSLCPWNEEGRGVVLESEDMSEEEIALIPLDILKYGIQDTLESQIYEYSLTTFNPHDNNPRHPSHPLSGYWAGHLWTQKLEELYSAEGLISITNIDKEGTITGLAEGYHGLMNVFGKIASDNSLSLDFVFDHGTGIACQGHFSPHAGMLVGQFSFMRSDDDDDNSDDDGNNDGDDDDDNNECSFKEESEERDQHDEDKEETEETEDESEEDEEGIEHEKSQEQNTFFFNRTPASAWRFYTSFSQTSKTARDRWSFAITAVLDQVKQNQFSWKYLRACNAERRRFLELMLRREVDFEYDYTPSNPPNDNKGRELLLLTANLHPADAQFYYSLIESLIDLEFVTHL
ncbi:hypothetical protein GYMLUDRAFT_251714 [Collybiopsis luxurians FD-317 M1]|uniref:Uncharacterized protein n=1 Tax=Collybiopsis luxurians FD-317 M1 TaxID=944289 RepID=A0A0D0BBW7_9AGAR|nr:hypothetical protein GYMLUDRAFT_251714 [Collybiopsis luxurians FD-317 M1]